MTMPKDPHRLLVDIFLLLAAAIALAKALWVELKPLLS